MSSPTDVPDVHAAGLTTSVLSRADLAALADLCVRCSDFFSLVEGKPGGLEVAEEVLSDLAPGMGPESQRVLAFWRGGALIAALDLIDGYPESGTWYVGLFIFYTSAFLLVGLIAGVLRDGSHSVEVTAAARPAGMHATPVAEHP